VIYHWTDRRGALRSLEDCLTGAAFGGLAWIGSTAFGPFTPVFGAIGGFMAVYLARRLWRALNPHGDDRSGHTGNGGPVS
jgi:hypothetical protein